MNHRVLMGKEYGFADQAKQPQTLFDRAVVLQAELSQRQALHVLHDERWRSVSEHTGIVESGNGGVIHPRQSSLFLGKAQPAGRGHPGIP